MLPSFDYARPRSLQEALKLLSARGAYVHAGGTDLLGCLRDRVFAASVVVALGQLKELRGVSETTDGVRIGALTSIADVAKSPLIRSRYALLAGAAREVASPQLRNQGTIGGNLCQKPRCWYYRGEFHCLRKGGQTCFAVTGENQYHSILGGDSCYIVHPSDTAPALVALGAKLRIAGPDGTRTLALEDFFMSPARDARRETVLKLGELVTDILVPTPPAGLRSSFRKIRARRSWDFALASLALAVMLTGDQITEARVVLGGAAPVPWRSREAEAALTGARLNEATASRAAEAAMSKAQPLDQNGYKVDLFRSLIEEQLLALRG